MSDDEQTRDSKPPTILPTVFRVGAFVAINAGFILLACFVVPKWKKIFADFGAELSSLSILGMNLSVLIANAGPLLSLSLTVFTPLYAWFDRRLVVTDRQQALWFTFLLVAGVPLLVLITSAGAITTSIYALCTMMNDLG